MPTKLYIHAVVALLCCVKGFAAGNESSNSFVTVVIRPAVEISRQGTEAIEVKIRLAPQTQAKLWKDEVCNGVPPGNGYSISQSGSYVVPVSAIEGSGSTVCLSSSDGSLRGAVTLVRPAQN